MQKDEGEGKKSIERYQWKVEEQKRHGIFMYCIEGRNDQAQPVLRIASFFVSSLFHS